MDAAKLAAGTELERGPGFPAMGVPQHGWLVENMENPMKLDDLGVTQQFRKPSIYGKIV